MRGGSHQRPDTTRRVRQGFAPPRARLVRRDARESRVPARSPNAPHPCCRLRAECWRDCINLPPRHDRRSLARVPAPASQAAASRGAPLCRRATTPPPTGPAPRSTRVKAKAAGALVIRLRRSDRHRSTCAAKDSGQAYATRERLARSPSRERRARTRLETRVQGTRDLSTRCRSLAPYGRRTAPRISVRAETERAIRRGGAATRSTSSQTRHPGGAAVSHHTQPGGVDGSAA